MNGDSGVQFVAARPRKSGAFLYDTNTTHQNFLHAFLMTILHSVLIIRCLIRHEASISLAGAQTLNHPRPKTTILRIAAHRCHR
ncbi:hypothetical protein GB937_002657 [Aspergillus fischeri]|nr:hypothetical protein GB937_002657 [Aspergillus fischeri]